MSRFPRLRAVIVDDEPDGREVVRTLLAVHSEVEVIGEAGNGRDAVDVVRRRKPDLLFLDIQMPDQDGFAVLEALGPDVPRGIVFVTAHDEHAIRAFDVHALDYVLKPFGQPRFTAAVTRALERLRALDALTLQRTLASLADGRRHRDEPAGELALADSPLADGSNPGDDHAMAARDGRRPAPLRRVGVRIGARTVIVDVDTIDWIEALGDYARIHAGRKAHLVAQRMHALEQALAGGPFLRVHRSAIVNVQRIRELHRESDGGGMLVLADGLRIRVARGRWGALQSALAMEEL